jgi:hypothetical protein
MCMGLRAAPIWGICPVRKGRTMARARNMLARTIGLRLAFLDDITDTSFVHDIIVLNDCDTSVVSLHM